jgi:hypothetical protein
MDRRKTGPTCIIHCSLSLRKAIILTAYISLLRKKQPIPEAPRSKAWVYSRLLAGITDSNPAGDIHICLL